MITGGTITYVEAKRESEEPISGLSINVGLDDVIVKDTLVEIRYTYTVTYAENVGTMKLMGSVFAEEEPALAKEISSLWEKEKRLPDEFAETVLNSINYACGTNGTLVARPLNLAAPMIPPRVKLERGAEVKAGKKK